jgi:hypothetical protein
MVKEIKSSVHQHINQSEQKVKRLGVKLVSIMISCWMIVGSTALGIVLPAYLVKQAVSFKWTKEAEAGVEKAKIIKREPTITLSSRAYQPVYQSSLSRANSSGERTDPRNNIRNMTNTLNETRYFLRSAADLGIR